MILKHMFDCGKMESKKKFVPKKADMLLLAVVMLMAVLLLFVLKAFQTPGSMAVVSHDGQTILRFPLSQENAAYYLVMLEAENAAGPRTSAEGGEQAVLHMLSPETWKEEAEAFIAEPSIGEYNLFICRNGEVQMIMSSCPDLICVHHRAVSKTGESIICLPHKLVIEITGTAETELDGVVY